MDDIERPEISGNVPMEWASDAIAEMLRKLDLKYIAMNPGASYRGFHDSLVNYLGNRDPRMLLCLHEDHVVAIAHGYARVTEEPMAAIVHSNVGLMHGLMQVFNAWCGRMPVYLMGATGPVDAEVRRPWVDWVHTARDQGALLRNYTKWDDQPASVGAALESMLRAAQICRTAPRAPVYVCIDAGMQEVRLDDPIEIPDPSRYAPGPAPHPSAETLRELTELLAGAARPLLLMGRMSRRKADWDRRVKLAEALGARVLTDLRVGAAFPTDHALHGPAPLSHYSAESRALFRKADVIVAFDCIDLGGAMKLIEGEGPVTARDASRFLAKARKGRKFTLVRVGLGWASDLYHFSEPLDYLGYDGGGGLGSGAGMAVGAGLALRGTGRIPITLIGDGDFMQGVTALWTAAHYRIPVLIVVVNNRSNFNDEIHQAAVARDRGRNVANKWIGMRIDDPPLDLSMLARGQGVEASGPVVRADDVPAAFETAIRTVEEGRPYLIDLHVVPGYAAPLLTRAGGGESDGTKD